ncbi:MAG: YbaB/EbfC family nucleoid-associated protein [Candidatus Aureabacteria bacterium]|nr:YbaB/EbfC family nucleoid-associated protein [Candidatus Auribacterota bacterium]
MNINKIMKQAQQMQQKMADVQKNFNGKEFEITAGGGAITLFMNGDFQINKLNIDPEIIVADDKEELEDLVISAVNQAVSTVKENLEKEMGAFTGGMGLPPGLGF